MFILKFIKKSSCNCLYRYFKANNLASTKFLVGMNVESVNKVIFFVVRQWQWQCQCLQSAKVIHQTSLIPIPYPWYWLLMLKVEKIIEWKLKYIMFIEKNRQKCTINPVQPMLYYTQQR